MNLLPKYMSTQNRIDGTDKSSIARLQPSRDVIYPNNVQPTSAPIGVIAPAHDTCLLVSCPSTSGVSFDSSFGRTGEYHPIIPP